MFGSGKSIRTPSTNLAGDAAAPAPGCLTSGMVAGTRVATTLGWQPVEATVPGDKVLTFDRGMQTVAHVTRGRLSASAASQPLSVPAGALGNAQPFLLLPDQSVLIESDVGEEIYGDPFTLVPAAALEGFRAIARVVPEGEIEAVVLHFARDEVVFGSAGALFLCPAAGEVAVAAEDRAAGYLALGREDTVFLIGCIEAGGKADDWSASRPGQAAFAL